MAQKKQSFAYAFASGHIGFADSLPGGALTIARGERAALTEFVSGLARRSRSGTEMFVPGVPEAKNDEEAMEVFSEFVRRISAHVPEGVDTIYSRAARNTGTDAAAREITVSGPSI